MPRGSSYQNHSFCDGGPQRAAGAQLRELSSAASVSADLTQFIPQLAINAVAVFADR